MQSKTDKRIRLKAKIRSKIQGTKERPRLSVFRSNKFIYAQVIDDVSGATLAQASDLPRPASTRGELGKAGGEIAKGTKTERAKKVGQSIAEVCLKANIKKVVFDRNGFKYTGRIKLLADTARAGGLKF